MSLQLWLIDLMLMMPPVIFGDSMYAYKVLGNVACKVQDKVIKL